MKLTACPQFQPQDSLFEGSRVTLISPGIQVLVRSWDVQYLFKPFLLLLSQFYLKTRAYE